MRALALALVLAGLAAPAAGELRVVATSPALADLARRVGGERVRVDALMRGPENPHHVSPTPGLAMKLRAADVFVHLGLDAEPWVAPLLRSARTPRLLAGAPGNVDASQGIELLEVPERGALSRAEGDIHVYGNTHFLLDPGNGARVGRTLAAAFARLDPPGGALYAGNADALAARLDALADRLVRALAPHRDEPVVTFHRTWSYFLARFGLEKIGEVEPKPGIAPGPRHVAALAGRMRERGARVVLVETYADTAVAERVASRGAGRVVVLAQEVGALPGTDTYEALFEHNVRVLREALAP